MLHYICSPEKLGISLSREHSSLSPVVTNSLSTPKFLSARVFHPLLQLWDTPRALWHQDDSRTRCARPSSSHLFYSGYVLRKKTSKPRIRAEMFDRWENVEEQLKNSRTCCQEILTVVVTDTYRLEGHQLRFNPRRRVQIPIDAPPLSQLDRPRLRVLVPPVPLSSLTGVTTNASPTKKILALVPDSIRNLMTAYKKNLLYRLDIANPFPPDLWNYVHGFGY